ncbi:MAG: response regulator [Taibaiella sp.]|nr:response regulator [Taibaiella sp.]
MKYRNILLIDDDEDDQEIFLSAVAQLSTSAQCMALPDATDALHKLSSKQISPDVIFLDLNMPVMNGQQFLMEIKKRNDLKNIPVIIISTSAHPQTIELTKDMGAIDFITKPPRYDELITILSSFVN